MYIDFYKYNYRLLPEQDRLKYIERDKDAYKEIVRRWLEKHIDKIVERKWEIEEIFVLRDISDFIKLLKEAETLYELGFFTSCIALVGISSEDFAKYLSIKIGKKILAEVTQAERLKELLANQAINQQAYDLLDNIRKLRNECLHYDDEFKAKSPEELKRHGITALNNLKTALKTIIGHSLEMEIAAFDLYKEIADNLASTLEFSTSKQPDNLDEVALKIRNATSHLLKMPIAFDPETQVLVRERLCSVVEIDYDAGDFGEITLFDLESEMPFIIDLEKEDSEILKQLEIKENDLLHSIVQSKINKLGMSAIWKFLYFRKME